MQSSLSSLTDNLSIIKIVRDAWKEIKLNKNVNILNLKIIDQFTNVKSEKFPNTYKLCNKDLNKFVLLLRKGVYPYEYMDSWERFTETALPPKNSFYSELNLEDISDEDYVQAQEVWNVFEIKNLGEYHDLYDQSDTLLLSDIFEKFREMFIEIYKLDPAHFLSAPGLAWKACLKKTGRELELSTDYEKYLLIESGIKGGI